MPKELSPDVIARREKKALRREKQRQSNALRAEKMRKARLNANVDILAKAPTSHIKKINIGCSGWFYWHWKNLFYGPELPMNEWFDHYTKSFKTVELNAPFYSWPTIGTVQTWIRQAKKKKLVYTVKVSELITHIKSFTDTKELIKDFGYIADLLGPYMGCFLFQLPPSFQYSKARLKNILSQLEPHRRNVVEFRHSSWWNETVFEAFKKTGTIFCSCSGPKLPEDLIKTAPDIYVRFHGTTKWYQHCYSKDELAAWTDKIVAADAEHTWVYFNNDRDAYAIKNAKTLANQLSKK